MLVGIPSLSDNDRFGDYREDVLNHIKRALVGVQYEVFVTPPRRKVGIEGIADRCNNLVEKALSEGFDFLWIVQADVQVPHDAFEKLSAFDVDVAQGVVPRHDDPNAFIAGFMDENMKVWYLPRNAVEGMVLSGWIFAGMSCTLIARRVLEAGIRFRYQSGVGEDILFMFDVQKAGFVAKVDGRVLCGHLPEWPLATYIPKQIRRNAVFGVLDVGCGHRHKGDVNVDLFVEATAHRAADQRVNDDVQLKVAEIPNFVRADACCLPFRDRGFRKVYSWHLIEHLVKPEDFLAECCRVADEEIEVRCPNGDPNWAYGLAAYSETKPLHLHRLTREWFELNLKSYLAWDWIVHFNYSQSEPWEIVVEGYRKDVYD